MQSKYEQVEEAQTNKVYTIDDAFINDIGEFGFGQQLLWLLASLMWLPAAGQTLVIVFLAFNPIELGYWECTQPTTDSQCLNLYQTQTQMSISDVTDELCNPNRGFEWQWTRPQYSVISDFDVECKQWYGDVTYSAFFLGFLVGCPIFGWYADKFGRKNGLFLALGCSCVFGIVNSVAWNSISYIVFQFLVGSAVGGIGLVSFILSQEPVGEHWRGFAGLLNQVFFPIGEMLLAIIAFLIRPWRLLNLVVSLIVGAFILLVFCLSESPRWLLVKDKQEQAVQVLERIAKLNNTHLPKGELVHVVNTNEEQSAEKQPASLADVFKNVTLRNRILVLMYDWAVISACYYGIQLNLGSLGGNPYFNIFLMGLVEMASYIFASQLVEKIGRNALIVWGYTLAGCACIICGVLPESVLKIVFALVGKFGASIPFGTAFTYTGELFPTVVRSQAMGMCSLAARVGGVLAPGVLMLGTYLGSATPFIFFGISTLIAAVLSAFLPETFGCPLMETFEDVQNGPQELSKYTLVSYCVRKKLSKSRSQVDDPLLS
eukprot:TRINITY_DN452_c0_g1_i1.p1 TRINITY_DN452_c0_g1~~TRINITY_DN452_c0_g1_i1.p1  ORF type:complete len:561 (-),score=50.14 TRINITY_DN452_c0_g1_i1:981-2615(-)